VLPSRLEVIVRSLARAAACPGAGVFLGVGWRLLRYSSLGLCLCAVRFLSKLSLVFLESLLSPLLLSLSPLLRRSQPLTKSFPVMMGGNSGSGPAAATDRRTDGERERESGRKVAAIEPEISGDEISASPRTPIFLFLFLLHSSVSQSSPLRSPFVRSISRLIPSRSLSRGRPREIRVGLRDGCIERRGPRWVLPHSEFGSLLFLHLRSFSFFLRGVEWRKKSPGPPPPIFRRRAACGWLFAGVVGIIILQPGVICRLLSCACHSLFIGSVPQDQNAEQHFNRATSFSPFHQFL